MSTELLRRYIDILEESQQLDEGMLSSILPALKSAFQKFLSSPQLAPYLKQAEGYKKDFGRILQNAKSGQDVVNQLKELVGVNGNAGAEVQEGKVGEYVQAAWFGFATIFMTWCNWALQWLPQAHQNVDLTQVDLSQAQNSFEIVANLGSATTTQISAAVLMLTFLAMQIFCALIAYQKIKDRKRREELSKADRMSPPQ